MTADEIANPPNGFAADADHAAIERPLVVWYLLAALAYLCLSMLAGMLMSLQLVNCNPLGAIELFSPGRWRMIHTNVALYGFLANALWGCLHWVVPRLTGRHVLSRRLAYFVFGLWQAVVAASSMGILCGYAKAIAGSETPVFVDPLLQAALFLAAINFAVPIICCSGRLPMSLSYVLATLLWMAPVYALGSVLPQYMLCGVPAAAIQGLFLGDLVGFFIVPMGWGLVYYFVPSLLNQPLWSRGLARFGFWGLALFAPLSGVQHFLYSPIPMPLQSLAIVAAVAINLVLLVTIANFFIMARSAGRQMFADLPLRWIYTGLMLYAIACVQGALQATFIFQPLVHFSDWDVGHNHLVLVGVFTFWLMGIMTHVFPRLLARPWHSPALCAWHYWLSVGGVVVMFLDLSLAGVLQGYSWGELQPWEAAIQASRPFWLLQAGAGVAIVGGQICFLWNIYRTWIGSTILPPALAAALANEQVENKATVLWVAIGSFAFALLVNVAGSTMLLHVPPVQSISELPNPNLLYQFEDLAQRFLEPFRKSFGEPTPQAAAEALRVGREVYVAEGCWQCHSQVVRPVANEPRRWGPISQAWEYQNALQQPALLGTRRVGPDLSREGGRHSNDWHAVHFFQTGLIAPGSPMPAYPWLFDGAPNKPTARGLAVITYVQWLGAWLKEYPYYEDYRSIEQMERSAMRSFASGR